MYEKKSEILELLNFCLKGEEDAVAFRLDKAESNLYEAPIGTYMLKIKSLPSKEKDPYIFKRTQEEKRVNEKFKLFINPVIKEGSWVEITPKDGNNYFYFLNEEFIKEIAEFINKKGSVMNAIDAITADLSEKIKFEPETGVEKSSGGMNFS